eukprot:scaffold2721_cov103-Skeletonema_marinoi.AAC.3
MAQESSASFQSIFVECEKRRPQYKGKSRSSFYLEFNGSRIKYDDSPHSLGLGMGDGDRAQTASAAAYDIQQIQRDIPLPDVQREQSPEATPDSLGMKGHATLSWSWEQTVSYTPGLDETLDMEGGVDNDMSSTIDIVFVDTSHPMRCCYDMNMMRT